MLRRLSDRARLEGMLALRKAIDSVRRDSGSGQPQHEILRAADLERRRTEDPAWLQRVETDRVEELRVRAEIDGLEFDLGLRDDAHMPIAVHDPELTKALNRISDAIDRVAAQLDSYHQERAEHLDAIEFLLREMVIGSVAPSAARSVVLGGVIDPAATARDEVDISLVPDSASLEIDAAVEVRSRFHDRWICGFSIAEVVEAPGRLRYRLTRRSDGIPLPILFDACDIREASGAFDRQHSPS